jgi:hypothetical protein
MTGDRTENKGQSSPSPDGKKMFKQELKRLFSKYGVIQDGKDCEIRIRVTSGNIAWVNINSIEIIK